MFKMLKNKFARAYGMPRTIKKYWYCGIWYMHRADEHRSGRESRSDFTPWPVEGKALFNPFKCGISQTATEDGLVDGLIPAYRKGHMVGLYRVVGNRYREENFYDGAMWDDGYNIDLAFVKAVHVDRVPSLQ